MEKLIPDHNKIGKTTAVSKQIKQQKLLKTFLITFVFYLPPKVKSLIKFIASVIVIKKLHGLSISYFKNNLSS